MKKEKKVGKKVNTIKNEFLDFIKKGNALAMAIGVIVGGAFTAIVTSINKDILMPFIGAIFGKNDFSSLYLPLWNAEKVVIDGVEQLDQYGNVLYTSAIYYGRFIQACIDFILIAIVMFIILKIVTGIINSSKKAKEKLKKKNQQVEEQVVEESIVEPVISEDILLLTEIRDLLKKQEQKNK